MFSHVPYIAHLILQIYVSFILFNTYVKNAFISLEFIEKKYL